MLLTSGYLQKFLTSSYSRQVMFLASSYSRQEDVSSYSNQLMFHISSYSMQQDGFTFSYSSLNMEMEANMELRGKDKEEKTITQQSSTVLLYSALCCSQPITDQLSLLVTRTCRLVHPIVVFPLSPSRVK